MTLLKALEYLTTHPTAKIRHPFFDNYEYLSKDSHGFYVFEDGYYPDRW